MIDPTDTMLVHAIAMMPLDVRRKIAPSMATTPAAGIHCRTFERMSGSWPDPVEHVLDELVKDRRVELVAHLLPISLGQDELGVAENAEVARDRRPRRAELTGDLTGGSRSVAKQAQDCATSRIGERSKGGVHALG
jgi:hypothetical protein